MLERGVLVSLPAKIGSFFTVMINMKIKLLLVIFLSTSIFGCGWFDRKIAAVSGQPVKTCVDGVLYLQFTSGATVAYTKTGKIKTCS